jgi:signal transduction histidine kinase/ActR/RegA family two-component response regulator
VKDSTPPSGGAPGSPEGLPAGDAAIGQREAALARREEAAGQREAAVRLLEQAAQAQSAALAAAQVQQQELREANAHLVLAKLEADALKEAALLARGRQDEFLAMLAHELRNPLAPISNAAALLARADGNPDMLRRIHGIVDRQVHHLARLVDQLLDVSRVTQGRIELHKQPTALSGIVEQAVQTHRALIEARHQQLRVQIPAQPLLVDGDPVRLVQVVGNLLHNAAKYTGTGGAISVTARQEGDAVLIEVQDTGIGIAAEALPHIFELFAQGDHSLARSQGGLGIGLTVVRSMVQLHGGTVQAYSAGTGQGSTFVVTLPALAQTELAAQPIQEPSHAQGAERILVIEDNADQAESLAMVLRLSGYEVETAPDGPSGLAMAAQLQPRVVVCDIGLPGMSGYEVAAQLRLRGDQAPLMIALTGYGTAGDIAQALAAGFHQHIAKPADVETLLQCIAQALHPEEHNAPR